MKRIIIALCALAAFACTAPHQKNELRAPAYPLITIDPYISAWSSADNLYDDAVRHWTTTEMPFTGVLRVDGKCYRFMGAETERRIMVVPLGYFAEWTGRYTTTQPAKDWAKQGFNDRSWKKGVAPFGNNPTKKLRTPIECEGKYYYIRREVQIDPQLIDGSKFYACCSYHYGAQIYINGVAIPNKLGFCETDFRQIEIPADVMALSAKDGKITMAMRVSARYKDMTYGDMGLYRAEPLTNAPFEQCAEQLSADVQATSTIYDFRCGGVDLKLTFTAPFLLDNLDLASRPVNYVTYDVKSNDGKQHDVQIYFESAEDWARHYQEQECLVETISDERFDYLRCSTKEQPILGRVGDNVRIDWGYYYLASEKGKHNVTTGCKKALRNAFVNDGTLVAGEGKTMALGCNLGQVSQSATSGYFMVGYDDIYSIQYFGENLRPYWNRDGKSTIEEQFAMAADEYKQLMRRCAKFDNKMMAEATKAGGKEYADLCALAYRQTVAAHKLVVTPNGELALFSKENFSNGCLGTVDITYPSIPMFLLYNTELAKALLHFIFDYSESGKWNYPYPAHDIGRYPWANGCVYSRHMPVEEAGNMLLCTSAVCNVERSADYALKHWEVLKTWADFLANEGFDREDELCTDDFAGRMSHSTNLSVKAIMGVAAFGDMAKMAGKHEEAKHYTARARQMAQQWEELAREDGYYRLTFQKEGTFTTTKGYTGDCKRSWSQKYNMVWDKVLDLDIFDDDVAETEIAFYLTKQNRYGLPLDSRESYTKGDWVMWTATMADDDEFPLFIKPMWNFMNETTDRIPLTDFYYTDKPQHVQFRCRSVVGGFFMKMLDERLNN